MSQKRLQEVREELLREQIGDRDEQKEPARESSGEGKSSHRIGLRNIAERIRLRYGNEGSLKILSSDENGTVIEIRVPYAE